MVIQMNPFKPSYHEFFHSIIVGGHSDFHGTVNRRITYGKMVPTHGVNGIEVDPCHSSGITVGLDLCQKFCMVQCILS